MSLSTIPLPRRRYKAASARDGNAVWLDDNELLTPARATLRLPTAALATAVAAEWSAQEKSIDPASMPLTQLAMTAVDRVAPQREAVIAALLPYLSTELICHEGEADDLRAYQQQHWQFVRDWIRDAHGAVLPATTGLSPVPFDTGWAKATLEKMDGWRLTATQQAASALGSLAIALALEAGIVTAAQAVDAAEAEPDWHAQRWGADPALESRRAALLQDITAVAQFLDLLKED